MSDPRKYRAPGLRTAVYNSYRDTRSRCNNPWHRSYADYGARGIKFLFKSFDEWFAELGQCPPGYGVDRNDRNGHYAPGNVRWATKSEQCKNRGINDPRDPRKYRVPALRLRTAVYSAYGGARSRCNNPCHHSYVDYGARGIKFLFKSFDEWFAELGPCPGPGYSVDRKDCNGHYAPGNVRWATKSEQVKNRRKWKRTKRADLTGVHKRQLFNELYRRMNESETRMETAERRLAEIEGRAA